MLDPSSASSLDSSPQLSRSRFEVSDPDTMYFCSICRDGFYHASVATDHCYVCQSFILKYGIQWSRGMCRYCPSTNLCAYYCTEPTCNLCYAERVYSDEAFEEESYDDDEDKRNIEDAEPNLDPERESAWLLEEID